MGGIAKQFGANADRVLNIIKSVEQTLAELRNGGYEGEDARKFFSEMDGKIIPAMKFLQDALTQTEGCLSSIDVRFSRNRKKLPNKPSTHRPLTKHIASLRVNVRGVET